MSRKIFCENRTKMSWRKKVWHPVFSWWLHSQKLKKKTKYFSTKMYVSYFLHTFSFKRTFDDRWDSNFPKHIALFLASRISVHSVAEISVPVECGIGSGRKGWDGSALTFSWWISSTMGILVKISQGSLVLSCLVYLSLLHLQFFRSCPPSQPSFSLAHFYERLRYTERVVTPQGRDVDARLFLPECRRKKTSNCSFCNNPSSP